MLDSLKSSFRFKIFSKMFLSYILYFTLPWFIIGTALTGFLFYSYRNDVLSLNMNAISSAKNTLDNQLAGINSLSYIFSKNYTVLSFAATDFSSTTDTIQAAKKCR